MPGLPGNPIKGYKRNIKGAERYTLNGLSKADLIALNRALVNRIFELRKLEDERKDELNRAILASSRKHSEDVLRVVDDLLGISE